MVECVVERDAAAHAVSEQIGGQSVDRGLRDNGVEVVTELLE